MGKHEIRLRRKKMTSRRIERHKNYSELLERHERTGRWKRLWQTVFYVLVLLVVLFGLFYLTSVI